MIYSKDLYGFSEEEILPRSPTNVSKVKRLLRANSAIMLTFSTEYFPHYVHFRIHIRMKVRRFRLSPKQCRNCFEYDHISDDCMNEERCYKCSKVHEQSSVCNAKIFCFLCDGIILHLPTSVLWKNLKELEVPEDSNGS